jgi:hypothetical protein
MPLKLRPTGLGFGIDKDRPDYAVCSGAWEIGRIYQTRGGPDGLRWLRRAWRFGMLVHAVSLDTRVPQD